MVFFILNINNQLAMIHGRMKTGRYILYPTSVLISYYHIITTTNVMTCNTD